MRSQRHEKPVPPPVKERPIRAILYTCWACNHEWKGVPMPEDAVRCPVCAGSSRITMRKAPVERKEEVHDEKQ
mgnify:CR=1 FL=1